MAKRKKKEAAAVEVPTAETTDTNTVTSATSEVVAEEPRAKPEQAIAQVTERSEEPSKYHDSKVPFSMAHNNEAGIRLLKFDRFKQTQLQFRDKPPTELHQELRKNGWTYRPEEEVYTKQYGGQGEPLALLEAKRLFNRLVEQLTPETAQGRSY